VTVPLVLPIIPTAPKFFSLNIAQTVSYASDTIKDVLYWGALGGRWYGLVWDFISLFPALWGNVPSGGLLLVGGLHFCPSEELQGFP
jgi:hypothetical protein